MVRYGDAMLFWCQTCNKCCIGKFGYRMSEDGLHDFSNRYIIPHDDEQVFYQIQSKVEPSNLDMIEPVLNWMKRQIVREPNGALFEDDWMQRQRVSIVCGLRSTQDEGEMYKGETVLVHR